MDERATSISSVVVVGGRDSGKSNYIFRLWLAINSGKGAIAADGLPDQLEYLQTGSQSLLKGEFAQRTQHEVFAENVIPIKIPRDGGVRKGKLVVPDCQGEVWMDVFRKRRWTREWEDRITDPCGFLIFVRPTSDEIVTPLDWVQCEKTWGAAIGEGEPSENVIPTQVVITEWLQFIAKAFSDRIGSGFRPRVAIVIAAWDRVPQDRQGEGPSEYLIKEFPLLGQFIRANADIFDLSVFGVSIAGGDFANEPGFREQSLDKADPLSAGYTLHELGSSPVKDPDLTLPVAWAMGFLQKVGG
jgi:hypothetical protein